jgi:hypothetical protein
MLHRVVWWKLTYVSDVLTASIIRAIIVMLMEAVSTSETSTNFYQTTWYNVPEDSDLHNRRCEKLKSQPHPSLLTSSKDF